MVAHASDCEAETRQKISGALSGIGAPVSFKSFSNGDSVGLGLPMHNEALWVGFKEAPHGPEKGLELRLPIPNDHVAVGTVEKLSVDLL